MQVFETIMARRSIRRFKAETLSREQMERIITAGIAAPSGKNKQPWRFVVVESEGEKARMCQAFKNGIDAWADDDPEGARWTRHTLSIVEQAPVTIAVIATDSAHPPVDDHRFDYRVGDIVDIQSIGAAIQNMLLAAWEMGIGSLWICDSFGAYQDLVEYFEADGLLVALVSFGIADQSPAARPRNALEEVTTWR